MYKSPPHQPPHAPTLNRGILEESIRWRLRCRRSVPREAAPSLWWSSPCRSQRRVSRWSGAPSPASGG